MNRDDLVVSPGVYPSSVPRVLIVDLAGWLRDGSFGRPYGADVDHFLTGWTLIIPLQGGR